MPSTPTDPSFLLKLLEIVLCLAGVSLIHQVNIYYSAWVMHTLLLGMSGFLLICSAIAISSQFEDFPFSCEIIFLSTGWILNLIGGCMVMVRYGLRFQKIRWTMVYNPSSSGHEEARWELALGVVAVILASVMFIDFIIVIVNKRDSDE